MCRMGIGCIRIDVNCKSGFQEKCLEGHYRFLCAVKNHMVLDRVGCTGCTDFGSWILFCSWC